MRCPLCGERLPKPWDATHPVRCPSCGAVKQPPHLDEAEILDRGEDSRHDSYIDDLVAKVEQWLSEEGWA